MNHRHATKLSLVQRSDEGSKDDDLRRLAAVGLMTPSIAHDVNNMLQTVASVLRSIDRGIAHGAKEEVAALAADGLRAIDRVAVLTKSLMAFGRPGPSESSRIDVNQLVRDLEPLLRWAVGPDVSLRLSLDHDPLESWCDPQDLENALMNLAINARDAMPEGGLVALHTFNAHLDLDLPGLPIGDYVIITVSDTGTGMTPEVAAHAFDPFFTTKAGSGGFGIGLASVKAFVGAAGGGADIISRPAEGTTVRLYLPKATAADSRK
jgi:C4-dicarboxylate-specific signal transduction histidine kinase